jgi:hypothetical protein
MPAREKEIIARGSNCMRLLDEVLGSRVFRF